MILTAPQVNQIIAKVMGKCWHLWESNHSFSRREEAQAFETYKKPNSNSNYVFLYDWVCYRCGAGIDSMSRPINPSYTSDWSDYGQALEWAMEQDWWLDFEAFLIMHNHMGRRYLLNPLRGSIALAEFIKEKGI